MRSGLAWTPGLTIFAAFAPSVPLQRGIRPRGEAHFQQGGDLFLATGSALLEQDGALISTCAPALVALRRPVKVTPHSEVRALLMPAV